MRKQDVVRSMTGYGKGVAREEGCSAYVEIKGMNHKYLEINIKLPDEFSKMELEIRKILKAQLRRGAVYFSLNFVYELPPDLEINSPLFEKLLNLEKEIEERHGISQPINIHFILNYPGVIKEVNPKISYKTKRDLVLRAVGEAMSNFLRTKEIEGENLKKDILNRITKMERYIKVIEVLEEKQEKKLEQKLRETEELHTASSVTTEKIAGIGGVSEEIVRFNSHIKMARKVLNKGGEIGRELDFIAQEMNREINTLASKALATFTSKYVIRIKSEIEKVREQALNIE